jgi:hypothetical protein
VRRGGLSSLRTVRRASIAVAAAILLASCGGGAGGVESDRTAGVYGAVLSNLVAEAGPTTTGDALPVVFVVPGGSDPIPARVQANVVKDMKDAVDVRFADKRHDAIDDSQPDMPVHDDGLLVSLDPVPAQGTTVDVGVELYRNATDHRSMIMHVGQTDDTWTVTSVSPAP